MHDSKRRLTHAFIDTSDPNQELTTTILTADLTTRSATKQCIETQSQSSHVESIDVAGSYNTSASNGSRIKRILSSVSNLFNKITPSSGHPKGVTQPTSDSMQFSSPGECKEERKEDYLVFDKQLAIEVMGSDGVSPLRKIEPFDYQSLTDYKKNQQRDDSILLVSDDFYQESKNHRSLTKSERLHTKCHHKKKSISPSRPSPFPELSSSPRRNSH